MTVLTVEFLGGASEGCEGGAGGSLRRGTSSVTACGGDKMSDVSPDHGTARR